MSSKIAAIVVTYNRKELLKECIDAILCQTLLPGRIFIINNASTDGTEQLIYENYINNSIIEYVALDSNTGGAGGFSRGIEVAYEAGYDWIWMMDDDVAPSQNCLEELFNYTSQSECVHPKKVFTDETEQVWEGFFNINTGNIEFKEKNEFQYDNLYAKVNYGCFEGMLVSRNIIDEIGFPDKRFFIGFDDRIYGYLASRLTNVLFINNAILHKKIDKRGAEEGAFSLYFLTRNYFLVNTILSKLKIGNKLNRIMFIHLLFLKKFIALIKRGNFSLIKILFTSYVDGLSGNYKNDLKRLFS